MIKPNIYPTLFSDPWSGLNSLISTQIQSFVVNFLCPILSLLLVVFVLAMLPSVITSYQQGRGDFKVKIGLIVAAIIVAIVLGSIWGILRGSI